MGHKVLLLLATVAAAAAVAVSAPQGASYSYRFAGPEQTKEETRDLFGNIRGSYSVQYPDGGGTLTYNYAHSAAAPVFRTTASGPLGPAGTVLRFSPAENSKASAFLIEMVEQGLDSREPPVITKTEAVLIEALPDNELPDQAPAVSFKLAQPASGGAPSPNALTRGGFINSKESAFLEEIRRESEENLGLGGRNPPIITNEAIIVEAAPNAGL